MTDGSENQPIKQRAQEVKTEQLLKIATLMEVYDGVLIGDKKYNELWQKLTVELNAIGPPTLTNIEWQNIWSEYEREQATSNKTLGGQSREAQLTHLTTIGDVAMPVRVNFNSEAVCCSCVIAAKQDVIIKQQEVLIKLQEKTNNLLEEIVRKDQSSFVYENRLDFQLHRPRTDDDDYDIITTPTTEPFNVSTSTIKSEREMSSAAPKSNDDFNTLSHSLNALEMLENGNTQNDELKESGVFDKDASMALSGETRSLPKKTNQPVSGASTLFENDYDYECNMRTCSTTYHSRLRTPFETSINWTNSMSNI